MLTTRWMLERERPEVSSSELHPLYKAVTTEDGSLLYYSSAAGRLVRERPGRQAGPLGGVLAGTGLTTVLDCTVADRRDGAGEDGGGSVSHALQPPPGHTQVIY